MTKEMQTLALVPQGSLEAYIRAANTYPMLTAEEERALAERLHYDGDLEAAKHLILSHLRFEAQNVPPKRTISLSKIFGFT